MTTVADVVSAYLQAHPEESADSDQAPGHAWAWRGAGLRAEAQGIMAALDIPRALRRFGDARVVGSVATDLLVKLDIDVHVLVGEPNLYRAMDLIYHMLLDRADVPAVRISDYRADAGLKLGIDAYPGPSGAWSIDIMVTDRIERTGFALAQRLLNELAPAQRLAIFAIKGEWFSRGLLEGGISTRIYEAVLDHGIDSVDGFRRYLAKDDM